VARAARVVVTTYNRLPLLRLALRGWRRQTVQDFALTVADDGSTAETGEFVRDFAREASFPVEHVWWEKKGFRRAGILNEAVRRSEGEPLLLFTDGDCVPPARFLERHLAAHGPRTLAVGGAVYLDRQTTWKIGEEDVDEGAHERLGSLRERFANRKRGWKSRIGVWLGRPKRPKILGLNVGIDRGLFEELNGYDERFVGYGLEDSDLRDRAMALRPKPDVRILYGKNDTVHLWHLPATTARKRPNVAYYETARPPRCEVGLTSPPSGAALRRDVASG
jgi:glycosyltransferase involved in cell wall biosynthesis